MIRCIETTFVTCLIAASVLVGCSKNPVKEVTPPAPRFSLSPDVVNIGIGGNGEVRVLIENIPRPLFAISFQLEYNSDVVVFDDSLGVEKGDYFSRDAMLFVRSDGSRIRLTLTTVQGSAIPTTSGWLCSLKFNAHSRGRSPLRLPLDELRFYDSEGEIIRFEGMEIGSGLIVVE